MKNACFAAAHIKGEARRIDMNYKVYKNGELLSTRSCTVFPKPYNETSVMEYVMLEAAPGTEIVVESEKRIESAVIRPLSRNIPYELRDGKIHIRLECSAKLSVEINGSSEGNLMIFAEPFGYPIPKNCGELILIKRDSENVGTLNIDQDDTVVYIEDGAVLHGNIRAEGCSGVTVCGRGRICMERYSYEMRRDYARSLDVIGCRNVEIHDIIIDDSNDWSMRINGCENVNISNVKIFGCRGNSDGIDVCGSRNVTVSDIFTRVWDDSFVVKSLGTGNTENVVFRDSVLWNDFARPLEVGVELRADKVRNIRFENIDIIHSSTGYPLMGIHHGDHAVVSDILFRDIRIEDAPGAQLFDIRIADSVWSRDGRMGSIRDITFSDIDYIGGEDCDILLSNSRVEGYSSEHDISGVKFRNIRIKGKAVKNAQQLGLDIVGSVSGVTVESEQELPQADRLICSITESEPFKSRDGFFYEGQITVRLENNSGRHIEGEAYLALSPRNMAEERKLEYSLESGESREYNILFRLPAGKYIFFIKNRENEIENSYLYKELEADISGRAEDTVMTAVNYYGHRAALRLGASDSALIIKSETEGTNAFVLYTAKPAPTEEGEVMFTAEETDFGEVCAYICRGGKPVPAPQLRCPAEITYVFRNEPKVGAITKTEFTLSKGQAVSVPFENIGADGDRLLIEIAIRTEQSMGLRYPLTLFHSTAPESTAHMFAKVRIKK